MQDHGCIPWRCLRRRPDHPAAELSCTTVDWHANCTGSVHITVSANTVSSTSCPRSRHSHQAALMASLHRIEPVIHSLVDRSRIPQHEPVSCTPGRGAAATRSEDERGRHSIGFKESGCCRTDKTGLAALLLRRQRQRDHLVLRALRQLGLPALTTHTNRGGQRVQEKVPPKSRGAARA